MIAEMLHSEIVMIDAGGPVPTMIFRNHRRQKSLVGIPNSMGEPKRMIMATNGERGRNQRGRRQEVGNKET
jgi:hypothetical protein